MPFKGALLESFVNIYVIGSVLRFCCYSCFLWIKLKKHWFRFESWTLPWIGREKGAQALIP